MKLNKAISDLEEYQTRRREEVQKLRVTIKELETQRSEYQNSVAGEQVEFFSQQKIKETEQRLESFKTELIQMRESITGDLQMMRTQILDLRNQALTELETQLQKLRDEKDKIETEAIPRLEKQLEGLQEKKSRIHREIAAIGRKIVELDKYSIETKDFEE